MTDTQITGTGAAVVAAETDDIFDSSDHVSNNNNLKNNNNITRLNTIRTHHYHPHIGIRFCKELTPYCSQ